MTPLKSLALQCGLSLKETTAYLDASEHTILAQWHGRRTANPKSLQKLRTLSVHLDTLAAEIERGILRIAPVKKKPPRKILLAVSPDDTAAKSIGLPFASCHEAMLSRVLGRLPSAYVPLVIFRQAVPEVDHVEVY